MGILTFEEIKDKVTIIAKKYHFPRIWLFGSYARDEATENSDIDLIIDTSTSFYEDHMEDFVDVFEELEKILGKSVDIVTLQSLNNKKSQNRMTYFVQELEKERRILVA